MSQGEGTVIFEDQIDQIGEIQRDLGRFATHFARYHNCTRQWWCDSWGICDEISLKMPHSCSGA